ncbi:MAG: AI-2E family transporter [Clostridia bacterium]|nr:AI-2E family transporter [Clostridia bacterium]
MDKDNRDLNHEPETEQSSSPKMKKKESEFFISAVKLVVIGILLYVTLNHLAVLFAAVKYVFILLKPLLIGALLAMIFNTLMMAISRFITFACTKLKVKIRYRAIEISSLVLSLLAAVLLIYIIADSIIPQLIESIGDIVIKIQEGLPQLYTWLDKIEEYGVDTEPIVEWLSEINISQLITQFSGEVMNILNTVVSSASTVLTGTFTAVTSIIFAVYVLANKRSLSIQGKKLAYAYVKESIVDRAIEIGRLTVRTFSGFISGQCLDAIILGIMCFIAMTIFGFPYALPISSMIIVTAIIPYVGAFIGGAFGVLLMIIDNPMKAVWFVVLFIVVQQIDNHVVYPRVVGGSVGLPAIWTFAAVIVGGSLWGIFGMVLFIPFFSVLYTIIRGAVYHRLDQKGIPEDKLRAGVDIPDENKDHKPSFFERIYKKIENGVKKIIALFKKKKKKDKK